MADVFIKTESWVRIATVKGRGVAAYNKRTGAVRWVDKFSDGAAFVDGGRFSYYEGEDAARAALSAGDGNG